MNKKVKHVLRHKPRAAVNIEGNVALLAKAYAYAKAGDAETAGELFVEASEDEALDGVMDAIASSVVVNEDEYEDIDEITASDNGDDDMDADDDGDSDDDDADMEDTDVTEVELPASVARLAARVQF